MTIFKCFVVAAALMTAPVAAQAATVTAGPGGFDNFFATAITYEDDNAIANRGTTLNRDNPLNALGAGSMGAGGLPTFFEIGRGSSVELTFGRAFGGPASVIEVTGGSRASGVRETAEVFVGFAGTFTSVGTINNISETSVLSFGAGPFDTLLIQDTTTDSRSNGFDIASVQVSAVPVPAAGLLLLSVLGGLGLMRRRTARTTI